MYTSGGTKQNRNLQSRIVCSKLPFQLNRVGQLMVKALLKGPDAKSVDPAPKIDAKSTSGQQQTTKPPKKVKRFRQPLFI